MWRGLMPKVSIGMPVFNGGKIREDGKTEIEIAIESLLKQTFEDFELVISDNASTDRTSEIIHRYATKDSRIVLFKQAQNIGSFKNFRFVLEKSKGEYFFWASHDDWWEKHFIASGIAALEKRDNASGAFGVVQYIDKEGRKYAKGYEFLRYQPPYHLDYDSAYLRIKSYIINNVTDHLLYAFFRRDIFNDFVWGESMFEEKKLIMHAIGKGSIIDCPDMKYINYYTFKTEEEIIECLMRKEYNMYNEYYYSFKDILNEIKYFIGISEIIKIMPIMIIKGNWHKFFIKYLFAKIGLIGNKFITRRQIV
jgi:glycosyltransferase involved in cell wall biosynthesis